MCVCVCTNNRKQYSEHGHRELHFVPADRVTAAAAGPAHKLRRLLPVSRLEKTLLSQGGRFWFAALTRLLPCPVTWGRLTRPALVRGLLPICAEAVDALMKERVAL